MRKKIKSMQMQIKELIKEAEIPQNLQTKTSDDICFKTDKNLTINYVNDALCQKLGFLKDELYGKSIFGTLIDNTESIEDNVRRRLNKMAKDARIINSELLIKNKDGSCLLMACHQRPILNEVLECIGISFVCKNISNAKELKEKLYELKSRDIVTGALNQESFLARLEQDFNRAKRYNDDFSLIVLEMRDLCDFINKGISFERGDMLLKNMAELCMEKVKDKGFIGRFEKTKIGMILNGISGKKCSKLAQDILSDSKPLIKKLGVDDYNAQMLIICHTDSKGFNDTFDNMLERTKRNIKNAAKRHEYGIITPDINRKNSEPPTKYENS